MVFSDDSTKPTRSARVAADTPENQAKQGKRLPRRFDATKAAALVERFDFDCSADELAEALNAALSDYFTLVQAEAKASRPATRTETLKMIEKQLQRILGADTALRDAMKKLPSDGGSLRVRAPLRDLLRRDLLPFDCHSRVRAREALRAAQAALEDAPSDRGGRADDVPTDRLFKHLRDLFKSWSGTPAGLPHGSDPDRGSPFMNFVRAVLEVMEIHPHLIQSPGALRKSLFRSCFHD